MLILLKNPRIINRKIYLPAGGYIVKRVIDGLGYLVHTGKTRKDRALTIVRFADAMVLDE